MNSIEERRCELCNKPYTYYYELFGRRCVTNLYEQLNIKNPRFISNKEKYLCNKIALRNHKFFLSKKKKYALAKNYIAMDYINKMNLKSLQNIKNSLMNNIKSISTFKKDFISFIPETTLNDFYKLYSDYNKFKELLNNKDNNIDEDVLKGFSIIFDIDKIFNPLYHAAFYDMQYIFWEVVVIGGVLTNMKLSAYLMQISLDNSGEYEEKRLIIDDENILKIIIDNQEFKNMLKSILVEDNVNLENKLVRFSDNDLLLSLHDATINLKANKNDDGTWNLNMEIEDRYDFTDIKNLREYITSNKSIPMSIFSSTLNNFAAISSSYNVIKPFNFVIKIDIEDYKI